MKRKIFLLFLILCCVMSAKSQKFVVNVPSQVSVGENFRLSYTIGTRNARDFRLGDIPDNIEVITGPYKSEQASFQMVNGHTTGESSITYTFILCASKSGTYTIPPAHIVANGKRFTSKVVKIKVAGEAQSSNNGSFIKF